MFRILASFEVVSAEPWRRKPKCGFDTITTYIRGVGFNFRKIKKNSNLLNH